ncbi:histidine kinase [Terrihabitans soli]|uniref:histidine kinase n=1 Tax=Terrihabitans soli TaxID=708113 RepID=A0A6S6QNK4_9HYPH|nr:sensor histidine kinase [Terrihabitans soli]BCJ92104.1 histidine kinase [Terrihabitans soli]
MSVDIQQSGQTRTEAAAESRPASLRRSRLSGFFGFSSLTRRIVVLNLAGLVALLSGILYLNQFRAGLIEARIQSLTIQGEIMAGAIAASATSTSEQDSLWVDPDKLMNIAPSEMLDPDGAIESLDFPINPERVAPMLRRLITPTRTRARIYDAGGQLLLDSQSLYGPGDILRLDIPTPQAVRSKPLLDRMVDMVQSWLFRNDLPTYEDLTGGEYPEVKQALSGAPTAVVRANKQSEMIVSVAVPIQRFRTVQGALMLSTLGGDIDDIVQAERLAIVRVFLVAALVMVVLSILLAGTIAGPVRRLANAADRVRLRVDRRAELPDFSDRNDEIGHLSTSFREMTDALYNRMEAIERFAADVAHELKNPLTSLRSAVETLPLAKTDDSKKRLLSVIEHDVRRLDRLISDISDASRLDAELQRQDLDTVDIGRMLTTITSAQNDVHSEEASIILDIAESARAPNRLRLKGHDLRLGQVFTNLIDNARSFTPPKGQVRVSIRRDRDNILVTVEDDGPGIRPDAIERIFERFYTDRPTEGFGQNSGLGLSISKQIVEAHGGQIWAENRLSSQPGADGKRYPIGARFTVRLPAAK